MLFGDKPLDWMSLSPNPLPVWGTQAFIYHSYLSSPFVASQGFLPSHPHGPSPFDLLSKPFPTSLFSVTIWPILPALCPVSL